MLSCQELFFFVCVMNKACLFILIAASRGDAPMFVADVIVLGLYHYLVSLCRCSIIYIPDGSSLFPCVLVCSLMKMVPCTFPRLPPSVSAPTPCWTSTIHFLRCSHFCVVCVCVCVWIVGCGQSKVNLFWWKMWQEVIFRSVINFALFSGS